MKVVPEKKASAVQYLRVRSQHSTDTEQGAGWAGLGWVWRGKQKAQDKA